MVQVLMSRMVEDLVAKVRRARYYNPEIFERLHWQMQDGTRLGRVANFLLWACLHVADRTRRRRDTPPPAAPDPVTPAPPPAPPSGSPLSAASRHSLGGRILIVAELSIPQCTRYRVHQKVGMFRRLGHETMVCSSQRTRSSTGALPST